MAIQSFYVFPDNSTDANFRAWVAAIHTALAALGFVQTADTGQINTATVVKPAASADAGYSVWRFADALQAANPVFFRMDFGATGTQTQPRIKFQVGQGSDGAGALNGQTMTQVTASLTSSTTAPQPNSIICGGADWLTMALFWSGITSMQFYLSLSRPRNAAGVAQAGGVNFCCSTPSARSQQWLNVGAIAKFPTTSLTAFCSAVTSHTSGSYGGELGAFPVLPFRGYADFPDLGFVLYVHADIAAGQSVAVNLLGTQHTYFAVGQSSVIANGIVPNAGIMVRYE